MVKELKARPGLRHIIQHVLLDVNDDDDDDHHFKLLH